jgi:hypothetical protein
MMVTFGDMGFSTFSIMSAVYRIQTAGLDPLQVVLVAWPRNRWPEGRISTVLD